MQMVRRIDTRAYRIDVRWKVCSVLAQVMVCSFYLESIVPQETVQGGAEG